MNKALQQLKNQLSGDLFFDTTMRTLYATDASAYVGITGSYAIPKTMMILRNTGAFAKNKTSLIPRTAGTH